MCWFHVVKNLEDKLIPQDEYNMVMQEIQNLHYSKSIEEFNKLKQKTIKRWKTVPGLVAFEQYFSEQWLESDFCNWQIFNSPQGFASTNNSIKSFNSRIKKFFTKREKLSLSRTIDRLCDELITYYSVHMPEFKWFREPRPKDKKVALAFDSKEFQMKDANIIIHQGKISKHLINIELKNCSCRWFLAYAMCAHLIKAGELFSFRIDDRARTRFVHRPTRGRKKQNSDFRQHFENIPPAVQPLARKRARQEVEEEEEPCTQVAKKCRGRPRIANTVRQEEQCTQVPKRSRGRPKLASSALNYD
jgi:hypothetical protein